MIRLLALGALVGPVLGVSSSLLAVQHAEIGVASTLMAWTKNHTFFYRYFKELLNKVVGFHSVGLPL